jgi:hypothetical protein
MTIERLRCFFHREFINTYFGDNKRKAKIKFHLKYIYLAVVLESEERLIGFKV